MTDIISEALDRQDTMPVPSATATSGTVQDGAGDCDGRDDVTVTAEEGSGAKQSQATLLVKLARDRYRLISGDDGRPYAVLRDGPNIAQPLRSRSGLKGELARLYADEHGGAVPSATALSDAVTALEGYARDSAPEPVHVRVAPWGDGIVLDLGTVDGRCVTAGPGGWRITGRSPVVFRRSALTLPIPDPVPGTLADLEDLLNFSQDTFRLVTGYVLAALVPAIPHPILALFGEQGTAKSTAARLLGALVDPSPAPLRSAPRDVPQWAVTASGSWVVCLDNVSDIAPWLSDTLCKAVTGDGIVNRALYTDDDLSVLTFRRVIMLTSIDAGGLRGDLGDRLLPAECERIADSKRRTDAEVSATFEACRPGALGALLTLLCRCLEELPSVKLDVMPRMADFTRLLAAVDTVNGWEIAKTYQKSISDIAEIVIESDQFAEAVRNLVTGKNAAPEWDGSAQALLEVLTRPDNHGNSWPRTPRAAGGRLRRCAPALRKIGVSVEFSRQGGTGSREITIRNTDPDRSCEQPS